MGSSEKKPGTIPLDNMRSKKSYSQAAGAKDTVEAKKQDAAPVSQPEDPIDEDLLDFDQVDKSELAGLDVPPQVPPRKHGVPLAEPEATAGEEDHDESKDSGDHVSQEDLHDFEPTSFSRRTRAESFNLDVDLDDKARTRRHIDLLVKKLDVMSTEKQIAEEKAEIATARVEEMKKSTQSSMSDIEKDTNAIIDETEKLREENTFLKEQLNDAQSHIFSLQPYRKDLTPEEVGREYDDIVEAVQDWVQKLMDPLLDDYENGVKEVMTYARKRPSDALRLKRIIQQYPDLVHATMFPETDEDVLAAIIMRFIHDNMFQKILYGEITGYTEMISFIENNMQTTVEPKRDLFSVRNWTAEAYNALVSARDFRAVRDRKRRDLTMELAAIFKVLVKKERWQWLCESIDKNIIGPSMQLYEKMQTSTHHFYLDVNPYIRWGPSNDLVSSTSEFLEGLPRMDCKNVLQSRKAFALAKLDPQPSKKELHHCLVNVCTTVPSLYMRQIGQRDAIKEPTVIRRQQTLVSWGSDEKKQKFLDNGDRPIVAHVYFARHEKPSESSGWGFRFS